MITLPKWRSIKPLFWGAVGGSAVTMFLGFFLWGNWYTEGGAQRLAQETSRTKVQEAQIAILAPMCAAKFNAQPDAAAKKVTLKAADSSYARRQVFDEASVTLPGTSYGDSSLADACAELGLSPPKKS